MEEKIKKKPPETGPGDLPPGKETRRDEPRPLGVGRIFKKVLIPPAQKEEG